MSSSRYISRMLVGALTQLITTSVRTFVTVTNVINHAIFDDILVSAKGRR